MKIGNHGVNDDKGDLGLAVWAGVMSYKTVIGPLEAVDDLLDGVECPDYSSVYGERWWNKEA